MIKSVKKAKGVSVQLKSKRRESSSQVASKQLKGLRLASCQSGSRSVVTKMEEMSAVRVREANLTKRGDLCAARSIVQDGLEYLRVHGVNALSHRSIPCSSVTSVQDPKFLYGYAIKGLAPFVEVVQVKKGGAIYQVPRPIQMSRGIHMASAWLVEAAMAHHRSGQFYNFGHALAHEVLRLIEDLSMLRSRAAELARARMAKTSGSSVKGGRRVTLPPYSIKSAALTKKISLYRSAKTNRAYITSGGGTK